MAAPMNNNPNSNLRNQVFYNHGNNIPTEDIGRQPLMQHEPQNSSHAFQPSQHFPPGAATGEPHMPSEQSNFMPPYHASMRPPALHQLRHPPPSLPGNFHYQSMGQHPSQIPTQYYSNASQGNASGHQMYQQQQFQQPKFHDSMNNFPPRYETPPPLLNTQLVHRGNAPVQGKPNQSAVQNDRRPTIQRDKEDEQARAWIDEWLRRRNKARGYTDSKSSSISISEAQEKTRQMIVLLAKLQKHKQQLETMKLEDKSIWEQKHREVMKIKTEYEGLHKYLTSEKTVNELKRKIAQRQSKRRRIKRLKQEVFERKQLEHAERVQKHKEINRIIKNSKQKLEQEKQEEAMKKEGDQILSEVRKKMSETNKSLQLLEGIQKLRKLRSDRLARQGVLGRFEGLCSGASFITHVTDMSQLLTKQLKTYKSEEDALKVILETEQKETREKELEKLRKQEEEKQLNELKRQESIIFGSQKEACPGDPMYPFTQYYTAAEHSLDALIQVRHGWDMHLVMPETQGSSQIPAGWVIPTLPASDTWATCLIEKT